MSYLYLTRQRVTCHSYMFLSWQESYKSTHPKLPPKLTFFSTLASRCLKALRSAGVQGTEPDAVAHGAPWPSMLGGTAEYRISGSFFSPTNLGRGRSKGSHKASFWFLFTMLGFSFCIIQRLRFFLFLGNKSKTKVKYIKRRYFLVLI